MAVSPQEPVIVTPKGAAKNAAHGWVGGKGMLWLGIGQELLMSTHESLASRAAGVSAVTAGYALNTFIAGAVAGPVGFVLGMAAEVGLYMGGKLAVNYLENAGTRDRAIMREATRVGFHSSDVFHTNEPLLLTQRQESLRAIQTSIMNARSSLGREAMIMRRSVDEYLPNG